MAAAERHFTDSHKSETMIKNALPPSVHPSGECTGTVVLNTAEHNNLDSCSCSAGAFSEARSAN